MVALSGSGSAVESHLDEPISDTASELLVAELALNDIGTVQAARKGKARVDGARSDEEIAFDLQAADFSAFIEASHDHRLALSIDRAIASDAGQIFRLAVLEQAEYDDHRAAVAIDSGRDLPRQTSSQRRMEQAFTSEPGIVHHRRIEKAEVETIDADMGSVHISPPAASKTDPRPSSKSKTVDPGLECVICGDDVVATRSFKAPCSHRYCRGCIVNLAEAYLRDESIHPLRCCRQPLPLEFGVFKFIPTALQVQVLTKRREYSVPPNSRVYCSNPRCSAFLGASVESKRDLVCCDCRTISCSQCKDEAHPGEGCCEHQLTLELRETASANKWQTCPGCHAIVELSQGCYHITCRCSTQFCYLCSARWKTCTCRQWDEDRLLDDAERRVRNEFGNWTARAEPAVHADRVQRRMEQLRENHECQDHFWRYRHGSGQCEECYDFLPIFLMRCTLCQTVVCKRCCVNRL